MIDSIAYIFTRYCQDLIRAFMLTLQLSLLSFILGFSGGLTLSIVRTLAPKPLEVILRLFVEIVRGTPMTVQLFFVYYALPVIGPKLDPFIASLIALSINSAVYQSEYLRSAMNSIPRTQWEAALSLGFAELSSMFYVVLPQSLRIAIPTLTNELIYIIKFSSIAYFVTLPELIYVAKWIGSKTFAFIEVYIIVAIFYVVVAFIIGEIMDRINRRLSIPGLTVERT
ncbi:MAG: amino acid ABC transporter permease [Ignisphaera sp.]|uniref:Amino acid ABC transporter permease n=1 Tax=Ignisphaera aggregans TaxID=334771 RepID=A0A7C4JL45_9CREN